MVNKVELLGAIVSQINALFDSEKAFKIKEHTIDFPHYCNLYPGRYFTIR